MSLHQLRFKVPLILAHLQRVDVLPNPFLLWVGTHLAVPSRDKAVGEEKKSENFLALR